MDGNSCPPTTHFYHWLSRHALGATDDVKANLRGDLTRMTQTMENTVITGFATRQELDRAIREELGDREVPQSRMEWFVREGAFGTQFTRLRPPFPSQDYLQAALALKGRIDTQVNGLVAQLGADQQHEHEHLQNVFPVT